MDPPDSNNEDDDVFFDALDDWGLHDCTGEDSFEPSCSASTLRGPEPVSDEPRNSHPESLSETLSPASALRCRPMCRGSSAKEATDFSFGSSIGSDIGLINDNRWSFRQPRRYSIHRNSKENEYVVENCDSTQGQVNAFPAPNGVREENNEESAITTAANDDTDRAGDSVDSAVEPGDSPSNLLEFIAGLVIKAIGFQINLFIMFITFPIVSIYHTCMFFIDPFRTMRRGKDCLIWVLSRVWSVFFGWIGPSVHRWFQEHKTIWKFALQCGWGLLRSIYVCFVLFILVVSSIVITRFMMKYLMEKPIQLKEILNLDYTKQSPVAYVPIISCAGVAGWEDYEGNTAVNKGMGARVIPPKHKVQVTVSLLVPESKYNRNLGIFQVRIDFLSSDGKTIASSSHPCMLRFKSEPIRLLLTFLKIAPLITGYVSETQTLNVKMRGFVERDVPTSCLKVTLEQRAEYQPGAGIPEIYDASLVLESELPFFKRIIWFWKKTIFIWIAIMTFMIELLCLLVCCRPLIIPRTRRGGSTRSTTSQNNLPVQG